MDSAIRFVKGHGTGNDFVLLPDPDGRRPLSAELARAVCDRRFGIGADGVLRVVRAEHIHDVDAEGAEWFMDHRNADGSIAAMCGNGIRLFARFLVEEGLAPAGTMRIGTRSGPYRLDVPVHGDVTVHMGHVHVRGRSSAWIGGRRYEGVHVDAGTQHLVCLVDQPLDSFDLTVPPELNPTVFPDGANVELVVRGGDRDVALRVHERGAGETLSCGTGACAVGVYAARTSRVDTGGMLVDVPGGRLHVGVDPADVTLCGPAVLVGAGILCDSWLSSVADTMPAPAAGVG